MVSADSIQDDLSFLEWLTRWQEGLRTAVIDRPEQSAVVVVDMVNGFCKAGELASERLGALIPGVVELLNSAEVAGVRHVLVAEDTHRPQDPEFSAFPRHCVRGSGEEDTVAEIASLPFASTFRYFDKPTLSMTINTGAEETIGRLLADGITTFVLTGDCTDLCVYQSASFIRLKANAEEVPARVVVPAGRVDTYDLPVGVAPDVVLPHPGDLMHRIFLYHLALLGCEVVRDVVWGTEQ